MRTPYRDAPPEGPPEPLPELGARAPGWVDVACMLLLFGLPAALSYCNGGPEAAVVAAAFSSPGLVIGLAVLALERPVRGWLERRHWRVVVKGVAELERKVASEPIAGPIVETSGEDRAGRHRIELTEGERGGDAEEEELPSPRVPSSAA